MREEGGGCYRHRIDSGKQDTTFFVRATCVMDVFDYTLIYHESRLYVTTVVGMYVQCSYKSGKHLRVLAKT